MYQEQIQLLFDYIKGLNGLLEFDTQSLEQTRDKQNYIPKTISYYPKDKFINYITSELTEKLQVQSNQIKEYCKLQNENLLHKIKSQEAIIQKLQQQIDEKPNHEDIYEIHVDLRTIQQTFTNEIQNLEKIQENRLICLNSNLKEYVAINEFEGLFESHIGDYISRLQSRFAPKELTISKLNTFDCQMNHISEQLLELKKFANTNISQLINKQNVILSDLTTTVKHHEYSQLVQAMEQCITQTQLNQFQNEILPKIEGLQNNQKDNQQSIDEFRQIIKRTDYDLLQKATKMDWQIQKKQNEEIQIQNQCLQVQLQNQTKEIQGFYKFYENQKQIMGNDLSQQIIENINTVICEQVQKSMESYNLADVSQQIDRLKDFLKQKANKNDIIDALNLKSNRLDFSGLETKVNNALKLFKSQMSIVSEFMELFGSETDIESMNFKKNTIQKLIFDTNSLQGNFMKLCQTLNNFKQEGESPQTARSTFRQKFNTSPKNTGVKLFLRPLLSNTQSVQQTKRNKLNSSMYC